MEQDEIREFGAVLTYAKLDASFLGWEVEVARKLFIGDVAGVPACSKRKKRFLRKMPGRCSKRTPCASLVSAAIRI